MKENKNNILCNLDISFYFISFNENCLRIESSTFIKNSILRQILFQRKNLSSHRKKDYVKMVLNRIKQIYKLQTFNAHFMYVIKQHKIVDYTFYSCTKLPESSS